MNTHGILGLFTIAILLFLVLNNAKGTLEVINGIGGQTTALTGALQGRGVTNNGITLSSLTPSN